MAKASKGKQAAQIVVLLVITVAAAVYTVTASREATLETQGDGEISKARILERKTGFMGAPFVIVQPSAGCAPAAIEQVNEAVRLTNQEGDSRGAMRLLTEALAMDPSCVQAGRVLSVVSHQTGQLKALNARFDSEAQSRPADPSAQLIAAFFASQLEDGKRYRQLLDRATAANPSAPLLQGAWARWWDHFAQPREFAKVIAALRAELTSTDDRGAASALISIYLTLHESELANRLCEKQAISAPDDSMAIANCLRGALSQGDAVVEAAFLKRYWALPVIDVSTACKHADLSNWLLQNTCRREEALQEAETAIAQGCLIPGSGQRRAALLSLERYSEAAEPPPGGLYWEGVHGEDKTDPESFYSDHVHRATGLIQIAQTEAALKILRPIAARSSTARMLVVMIEDGVAVERLTPRRACKMNPGPAGRDGVAGTYINWGMVEEARPILAAAVAESPTSAITVANQINVFSIDGDLAAAVKVGEQALAAGTDDAYVNGNLGYVYQRLGKCEKAVPLMRKAVADRPFAEANYTNLARCLTAVGADAEAAKVWRYVEGGAPEAKWWVYALLAIAAIGLYLGGKFALIKLLPKRFGQLKFP